MPDYGISSGFAPMYQGQVAFTSGNAATIFTADLPTAGDVFSGTLVFHIQDSDGTDYQNITQIAQFSAQNKAGTLTVDATYSTTGQSKNVTAGTLTTTFTVTASSTTATYKITPTSSLTLTTAYIKFTILTLFGNKLTSISTT